MARATLADLLGVVWDADFDSLKSRGDTLRIVDGPGRADLVRSMTGGFNKDDMVKVTFYYQDWPRRKKTIVAKVSQLSAFESYPCVSGVQIKGWLLHPKEGHRIGTFRGHYDPQVRSGRFECKLKV